MATRIRVYPNQIEPGRRLWLWFCILNLMSASDMAVAEPAYRCLGFKQLPDQRRSITVRPPPPRPTRSTHACNYSRPCTGTMPNTDSSTAAGTAEPASPRLLLQSEANAVLKLPEHSADLTDACFYSKYFFRGSHNVLRTGLEWRPGSKNPFFLVIFTWG